MKVIRKGESPAVEGTTFTGHVSLERAHTMEREGGMSVSLVHVDDGALTNWHVHPGAGPRDSRR